MRYFFEYNWQVRDEWFDLCKTISHDELYEERIGGVRSFAHTFFHIIKVEHDWICDLQEKPIYEGNFDDFKNLSEIIQLSRDFRIKVKSFIHQWNVEMEHKILNLTSESGSGIFCTYGEVMRHVIAHEIHHIGQLSIWAREIGMKPVNANFIHRGIFIDNKK